jgi:hypothetical protein
VKKFIYYAKFCRALYTAEITCIYSYVENGFASIFQVICFHYIGNSVTTLYLSLTAMDGVQTEALLIPDRKENDWDPSRGLLNVMLVWWRILSQYCYDLGFCAWLIKRVLDWMIGFDTLFIQLGITGNYSSVADLHTLQFTAAQALGSSVFISRILATDL